MGWAELRAMKRDIVECQTYIFWYLLGPSLVITQGEMRHTQCLWNSKLLLNSWEFPKMYPPKLYSGPTIQSRSAGRRAAQDLVQLSIQLNKFNFCPSHLMCLFLVSLFLTCLSWHLHQTLLIESRALFGTLPGEAFSSKAQAQRRRAEASKQTKTNKQTKLC